MPKVVRPWGWFEIIHEDEFWTVKKIHINKGHRLSEQYHKKKAEVMFLPDRKVVTISPMQVHRIEAIADLDIIEVAYSGLESDIIRLQDDYNRVKKRITKRSRIE